MVCDFYLDKVALNPESRCFDVMAGLTGHGKTPFSFPICDMIIGLDWPARVTYRHRHDASFSIHGFDELRVTEKGPRTHLALSNVAM
jgi:hypothetical protein